MSRKTIFLLIIFISYLSEGRNRIDYFFLDIKDTQSREMHIPSVYQWISKYVGKNMRIVITRLNTNYQLLFKIDSANYRQSD